MRRRSFLALAATAVVLVSALTSAAGARAATSATTVFLVARPDMPDPLFAQSVILMLPRSGDFPLVAGLIVNKPIREVPLHKLFPGSAALKNRSDTAFLGGPVDIEAPAIVFRADRPIDKSTHIAGDVYVTLDPDLAAALAQDPKRVHDFRLILGRSQWTPDQLHSEIMKGAWYTVTADAGIVFSADPGSLWNTLAARARLTPVGLMAPAAVPQLLPISGAGYLRYGCWSLMP
ncbi:MAG TPA: YqgE/AlgH family protein [Candidatus Binataceae bacterium]|nr:YqgE/AlgH family protein [Candidatus Binataceae bacterium]